MASVLLKSVTGLCKQEGRKEQEVFLADPRPFRSSCSNEPANRPGCLLAFLLRKGIIVVCLEHMRTALRAASSQVKRRVFAGLPCLT